MSASTLSGAPVLVVGAGIMGAGIAQVAAQAGHPVWLHDAREGAAAQAKAKLATSLQALVAKGRLEAAAAEAALARIQPVSSGLAEAAGARLVVEAIVENLEAKRALFRELEAIVAADCVLATNTSSISVTAIANGLQHPQRLVGMHFFNPVPLMALVEVIPGIQTSKDVVERTIALATKMGKTPLKANDRAGFISNRVLMPMINEAFYAWMEGVAEPEAIDGIMKLGCNFPMGPLRLADFIGLDTCVHIMNVLADGLNNDRYRACPLLKQLVTAGRMGDKAGRGVYEYPAK
jgi:3-hydroxybutyryl-CoA dehydrogenase